MVELEKQAPNFALDLVMLYTSSGDYDRAFHFLEKPLRHKIGDMMMFRSDILLKPLRVDPRFKEMEAILGEVPELDF